MNHPESILVTEELAVAFETDADGGLRLRVVQPLDGGQARFEPPFAHGELEHRMTGLARQMRHLDPARVDTATGAREIGRRLFESLAVGDVGRCLGAALDRVFRSGDATLRLRLVFEPTDPTIRAVSSLPWELLFDSHHQRFLARCPNLTVVRFLAARSAAHAPRVHLPLRVLVVVAEPPGCPTLEAAEEVRRIRDALHGLQRRVVVEDHVVTSASHLRRVAREGRFNVVHFVCHGDIDRASGQGVLILGGPEQGANPVTGRSLADALGGLRQLRLVVLNACNTARQHRCEDRDPYSAVAAALVRGGAPAVVAMQLPISDRAAIAFSSALYSSLGSDEAVDVAVAEARTAIQTEEHESLEWAAPALFLQVADGRLFNLRPASLWPPPRSVRRFGAAVLVIAAALSAWWAVDPGRPYRSWLNPVECPSPTGIGMRFVRIDPGSLLLEPGSERQGEVRRRLLRVNRPFCMGAFEITQRQWRLVMGTEADHSRHLGSDLPVQRVSFEDALRFIAAVNERAGTDRYRLPTEAEWEYAARAGTTAAYSFGDDPLLLPGFGNCLPLERGTSDHFDRPAPVGSFRANPWGLWDMHGNVWEWVSGASGAGGGPLTPDTDQTGAATAVRRGGAFDSAAERCRSASRDPHDPARREHHNGLRIVCEVR